MVVARESIQRAGRALAPRAPKRKPGAPKRKPPKSMSAGRYTNKKGQTIVIRRTYARNPTVEFKQIAFGAGGLAIGWIAAEFIDRYVATRAPEATNGVDTKPLYGPAAAAAIPTNTKKFRRTKPGEPALACATSA